MSKELCSLVSYDEWLDHYCPIQNPLDEDAEFDGMMFKTSGGGLRRVKAADASRVWSLVDECGRLMVVSGYLRSNRIGYFITECPWIDDMVVGIE